MIGFVNVLYGGSGFRVAIGKPLGGTEFSNMHAAYEALPEQIKTRLANATVTHAFEKFWGAYAPRTRTAAGRRCPTNSAAVALPWCIHCS